MADNITAPGAGTVLAADDIGGVHYPRTKISIGADGAAADISAANPMPVALDSSSLAALETTELGATTLAALENITATVPGVATATNQATQTAAIDALAGGEYETVAASQTTQALGAVGAAGDLLSSVLVIPANTSPGNVLIKDGAGTAITVFAGGGASVGSLVPFAIPINAYSVSGAWQITTGAGVSVLAVGRFS